MIEDLKTVKAGDVVLLRLLLGANIRPGDGTLSSSSERPWPIPMIDIAYQGFGDGPADGAGVRVAASCDEVIVAASCSKNFGIYRERTGILMAISKDGNKGLMHDAGVPQPPELLFPPTTARVWLLDPE